MIIAAGVPIVVLWMLAYGRATTHRWLYAFPFWFLLVGDEGKPVSTYARAATGLFVVQLLGALVHYL